MVGEYTVDPNWTVFNKTGSKDVFCSKQFFFIHVSIYLDMIGWLVLVGNAQLEQESFHPHPLRMRHVHLRAQSSRLLA